MDLTASDTGVWTDCLFFVFYENKIVTSRFLQSFIWILSNLCFSKCRSKASIKFFQIKTFSSHLCKTNFHFHTKHYLSNLCLRLKIFAFSFRQVMCYQKLFLEDDLSELSLTKTSTNNKSFWLMIMSLVGFQILNF